MKKPITALLVALSVLLALPGAVSADVDRQVGTPPTPDAHTTGGYTMWQYDPDSYGYGFSYFVYICTVGFNTDADNRVIDAANEWNEIGGEYALSWSAQDQPCYDSYWAGGEGGGDSVIMVTANGDLGGTTLATTWPWRTFGVGDVEDCKIHLDMDNYLGSPGSGGWGSYTWHMGTGSPSSSQVDIESVLVHEIGHCLARHGHSNENGSYVMNGCLNPIDTDPSNGCSGNPKGVEKDETWTHDRSLYIDMYGDTH